MRKIHFSGGYGKDGIYNSIWISGKYQIKFETKHVDRGIINFNIYILNRNLEWKEIYGLSYSRESWDNKNIDKLEQQQIEVIIQFLDG